MNPSTTTLLLGRPRTATGDALDAPALLARWRARGPAFLDELRGPFALALQDPDSGAQLLAVDGFAQQTLCWRVQDGKLRFSADARELGSADALEPQALFDYLFFHCIPSPRTIYRDVQRLPAGHCLLWDGRSARLQRYWQPRFEPDAEPAFEPRAAAFRNLVEQAVRTQLEGAGTPACFLSGGTDSSTVAGMVQRVAGRCEAYSIGFEAEGYDETAYARIAAQHFGVQHHAYYVTPKDLREHLPSVAAHFDQPFGNSSALPTFTCARLAQQDGVQRLLAGDGGDELFGGNSRYATQRLFAHYQRLPGWLRAGMEPLLDNGLSRRVPGLKKGASFIDQVRQGMPGRLQRYNLLTLLGLDQVLSAGFLAAIDASAPAALQQSVWDQHPAADELNTHLAFDWRFTLAENDLVKVRGACQLAGLEVGFPLLDDGLRAFSERLPVDDKLKGEQLRWFFKEALRGFLPDAILSKTKHGFGLPFGPWLAQAPELQDFSREHLHSLAARGLLRADFIERLLREYLPQAPGYYGEMVWITLSLELWLQRHAPAYRL